MNILAAKNAAMGEGGERQVTWRSGGVLPGVPLIRFGVVLVGGDEVDLSFQEVREGPVGLPLEVELYQRSTRIP